MGRSLQLAVGVVNAKVLNADREVKLILNELLSYLVDGHEHMAAFASGRWDGRSTFFQWNEATFPAGFAHMVRTELTRQGYTVQTVSRPLPAPLGPANPIVDSFGNDDARYDYQMRTVDNLLRYGKMIAQIATGGGKSKIAKLAVARIRRTTLFLTTRSVLMYQMGEGFKEAGFTPGYLGDGEWELRRGVNCAMVQTLMARLKEPEENDRSPAANAQRLLRARTIKTLSLFEFVIGEEAHEAGGNSYYEILRHCKNAHYRLALTATPFMREDAEANMRLMAAFGPIGIQVSEKMLIERGILAKPYFKFIRLDPPKRLYKTTAWQKAYKIGIVENPNRNQAIVFEAIRAVALGLPVMILVQHKAHGKLLEELLVNAGARAKFIFGEHDNAQRRAALSKLASGEIGVLIGSTILDVGVDVPAVGMVILAGGGKAEVALRQRIGRGLRAKKSGSNVAFILDFEDPTNLHLREHAQTRRAIIEATPGFAENILLPGQDFDFAGLGVTAKAS